MKISFLLPNIDISGGVKAVFEFSNHLHRRGHEVQILYPEVIRHSPTLQKIHEVRHRVGRAITPSRPAPSLDWFDLEPSLLRVPTLAEKYVPDADIILATWWVTAYAVAGYHQRKGVKFYLAQHYETWGGPERKVNNSYGLGLRIVVNSNWLKTILEEDLGSEVEALVLHSPDREQFYWEGGTRHTGGIRILMPYRNIEWKGVKDGIAAFEIAKKRFPDIQLVMYGPKPERALPRNAEFHLYPVRDRLRALYNSCEIFVFPSHVEGFGMPPMEAMLCKCAVATTNVGAVPDYAVPGETALVSPPRSHEQLAENIIRLLEDTTLRERISEAGHKHVAENFSWEKSTAALEQVLERAHHERPGPPGKDGKP